MVFLLLVVFGFSTKPLTMIRLFAELSGHYPRNRLPIVQANASRQEPAATKAMNAPTKAPSA
jgi:hypothetical protein